MLCWCAVESTVRETEQRSNKNLRLWNCGLIVKPQDIRCSEAPEKQFTEDKCKKINRKGRIISKSINIQNDL